MQPGVEGDVHRKWVYAGHPEDDKIVERIVSNASRRQLFDMIISAVHDNYA
jgi:hypothetical protein